MFDIIQNVGGGHIKTIDLDQTIYQLVSNNPELKDVLVSLGFKDLTKPIMLQTVGKIMTLKKGALMRQIDYQDILDAFMKLGYQIKEK